MIFGAHKAANVSLYNLDLAAPATGRIANIFSSSQPQFKFCTLCEDIALEEQIYNRSNALFLADICYLSIVIVIVQLHNDD